MTLPQSGIRIRLASAADLDAMAGLHHFSNRTAQLGA